MLLLAFTYPFDFERHAFLTRHFRASTLWSSEALLAQWHAWSLCDCVLNVKVQYFWYGLMNQRDCTVSTGMFTEKRWTAHRGIWSFFQLHWMVSLTLPDANLPFTQAWDRHWEYNNLWPPEAGSVSLNMNLSPGKTLEQVTCVQVVS